MAGVSAGPAVIVVVPVTAIALESVPAPPVVSDRFLVTAEAPSTRAFVSTTETSRPLETLKVLKSLLDVSAMSFAAPVDVSDVAPVTVRTPESVIPAAVTVSVPESVMPAS